MRLWDGASECRSHPLRVPRATYRKPPACVPRLRLRRQTTCRVEPQSPERPACARAKRRRDAAVKCLEAAQSRPPSAKLQDSPKAIWIALFDISHDCRSSVEVVRSQPGRHRRPRILKAWKSKPGDVHFLWHCRGGATFLHGLCPEPTSAKFADTSCLKGPSGRAMSAKLHAGAGAKCHSSV